MPYVRRSGMGATACHAAWDPLYPQGCPSGFSLQQVFYVPNSQVTGAIASTPGAVPFRLDGCPQYACQNPGGSNPVQQATCPSNLTIPYNLFGYGAAAAALLFLPGLLKVVSIPIAGWVFLNGYRYQPGVDNSGNVSCAVISGIGL